MEKTERAPCYPPVPQTCALSPWLPGEGLEGASSVKPSSGARKATGLLSRHRVPGDQEPQQWPGSGERESQKHAQPVGVRLQGCALPWHLPRASPGELLNETAPDQSNQFRREGTGPENCWA